jgi:hypothetical protein
LVKRDGTLAVCTRTESDKPFGKNAAGWIHRVGMEPLAIPRRTQPRPPKKPSIPAGQLAATYRAGMTSEKLDLLMVSLQVSLASLKRLGVGYSSEHKSWTFPMYDEHAQVIGLRLRLENGKKISLTGSRSGLFIPFDLADGRMTLVCEGPTDLAALLDLGFEAIGRPDNQSCLQMLTNYCLRRRGMVVIICDKDKRDTAAEKSTRRGAELLASGLATKDRKVKIIRPPGPYKDVRQSVKSGMGRGVYECLIAAANFWKGLA